MELSAHDFYGERISIGDIVDFFHNGDYFEGEILKILDNNRVVISSDFHEDVTVSANKVKISISCGLKG